MCCLQTTVRVRATWRNWQTGLSFSGSCKLELACLLLCQTVFVCLSEAHKLRRGSLLLISHILVAQQPWFVDPKPARCTGLVQGLRALGVPGQQPGTCHEMTTRHMLASHASSLEESRRCVLQTCFLLLCSVDVHGVIDTVSMDSRSVLALGVTSVHFAWTETSEYLPFFLTRAPLSIFYKR